MIINNTNNFHQSQFTTANCNRSETTISPNHQCRDLREQNKKHQKNRNESHWMVWIIYILNEFPNGNIFGIIKSNLNKDLRDKSVQCCNDNKQSRIKQLMQSPTNCANNTAQHNKHQIQS